MNDERYLKIRAQIQGVRDARDVERLRRAIQAEPDGEPAFDRQALGEMLALVASARGIPIG